MKNIKFQIVKYFFILLPFGVVNFVCWMCRWNLYERNEQNAFTWIIMFFVTLVMIYAIYVFQDFYELEQKYKKLLDR